MKLSILNTMYYKHHTGKLDIISIAMVPSKTGIANDAEEGFPAT